MLNYIKKVEVITVSKKSQKIFTWFMLIIMIASVVASILVYVI